MSNMIESLQWRYATKKFDPTKKLSEAQLQELMDAIQLSASSFGLQAYRIALVTDPAIRAKVREHGWGQSQITDASHLFAFMTMKSIDETYVKNYIALIAKTRGIPTESLKGYEDMMMGTIKTRTPEEIAGWLRAQAYIASGFLLTAAAHMGIDTCPMEGFDPIQVDIDLGVANTNLTTAMLIPVGFRAADDATASYKKVRTPKEELFMEI